MQNENKAYFMDDSFFIVFLFMINKHISYIYFKIYIDNSYTFIHQGCIQLVKNGSKDFYAVLLTII